MMMLLKNVNRASPCAFLATMFQPAWISAPSKTSVKAVAGTRLNGLNHRHPVVGQCQAYLYAQRQHIGQVRRHHKDRA